MSTRRLLILEDDEDVAKVIGIIALACGLETRLQADTDVLSSIVDDWEPTDILIDLGMSGRDGGNVLSELAKRGCAARIIVASGTSRHELDAVGRRASAEGLNVVAVLAKPFSAVALRREYYPQFRASSPLWVKIAQLARNAMPYSEALCRS